MWTITYILVAWLTISLVRSHTSSLKGCYSSNFVEKYAFYYRINQTLALEQSFAACDHRLTTYIGLQVDKSTPNYNVVYCGNDLSEVSVKVNDSACHPCQENVSLSCGGDGVMSVYSLRESTPLAVLLTTNKGVEMLIDNTTTLRVPHNTNNSHNYVDYIYSEDLIILSSNVHILRSYYIPWTMKYTGTYNIGVYSYTMRSLAVDYTHSTSYCGYDGNNDLYEFNLTSLRIVNVFTSDYVPNNVSVDSYSRRLVFLEYPYDAVYTFFLDKKYAIRESLGKFHVHKIKAITLEAQEKVMYAVLTLNGDNTSYLVSLDYEWTNMRAIFSGPQLENVTTLEVCNGDAVWLTNTNRLSTIYKCKLTPRCSPQNLVTIYSSIQRVDDLSIYHPEKQTPGKKWLCANMSCVHGCELVSPFTARCTCPPGMAMDPGNNTCYDQLLTKPFSTHAPSSEDQETMNQLLTKPFSTHAPISEDQETTRKMFTQTTHMSTLRTNIEPENKTAVDSGLSFMKALTALSLLTEFVMLFAFITIIVVLNRLYRKVTQVLPIQQSHELKDLENEYVDIPVPKCR